jgi:hypothetical protein
MSKVLAFGSQHTPLKPTAAAAYLRLAARCAVCTGSTTDGNTCRVDIDIVGRQHVSFRSPGAWRLTPGRTTNLVRRVAADLAECAGAGCFPDFDVIDAIVVESVKAMERSWHSTPDTDRIALVEACAEAVQARAAAHELWRLAFDHAERIDAAARASEVTPYRRRC